MFAQRRNRLTTHFSERIPVVKRRIFVIVKLEFITSVLMMIEVILDITTCLLVCTGRFIMFSVITNIYNKKTKGPTLMELFTATGKLTIFLTNIDVRRVHHVTRHTSIRYSSSCHTYVNMGASVFFTAVMNRALGQ